MKLDELQRRVDQWIGQWEEGYWSLLANLACLTEEVGELSREINAYSGPKPKKEGRATESRIAEELGDILFVVVLIANILEIDLGEAIEATLEKYETRDEDRWTEV